MKLLFFIDFLQGLCQLYIDKRIHSFAIHFNRNQSNLCLFKSSDITIFRGNNHHFVAIAHQFGHHSHTEVAHGL